MTMKLVQYSCLEGQWTTYSRNGHDSVLGMEEASYLEANLGEPVQAEVVTDEDGYVTKPKFQDAPTVCKAPPKKQSKNSCNKHTRCSCAQFSKQIAGLFDVGKC